MDVDLSFLEAEDVSAFDFDRFIDNPQELFSFNIVVIANDKPDIQVMSFQNDMELSMYISSTFGSDAVQAIIKNHEEESSKMCPYFRIIMDNCSSTSVMNFKLQTLLAKTKNSTIIPRCHRAMVIGLTALTQLDNPISIPYCFTTTDIKPLQFCLDDDFDLACLKPCNNLTNDSSITLCDIAGISFPRHVPWEVQWRILSFLRSPTAELIDAEMVRLTLQWDFFLFPMFQQREPRIPCHIASFFNANTVQQTTDDATRPYLAPSVSSTDAIVFPTWMENL